MVSSEWFVSLSFPHIRSEITPSKFICSVHRDILSNLISSYRFFLFFYVLVKNTNILHWKARHDGVRTQLEREKSYILKIRVNFTRVLEKRCIKISRIMPTEILSRELYLNSERSFLNIISWTIFQKMKTYINVQRINTKIPTTSSSFI